MSEQRWISVNEMDRLPEYGQKVLVGWPEADGVATAKRVRTSHEHWEQVDDNTRKRVVREDWHWDSGDEDAWATTHWQPLPEPPDKESK